MHQVSLILCAARRAAGTKRACCAFELLREPTMNGDAYDRGWISWISVLAYVGLCGLVYLLH
jgi:hypothetical protein